MLSFIAILPFLAIVDAANDWAVPCITGECSYDIPTTNGSASGTVTIWGSQDSITDITAAADWEILGCDPNALSQDIRLVCKSDDPDSKCSHLYQNIGAENKLVRLPENCGSSAFARVAKAWVPEDQSIPSTVAARLVRRDGTQPQVKALSLDTNFDAVDWSKTGAVNIAIQGANVPGGSGTIQIPPSRRNTRLSQRGLFGFVKNAIKSIASNSIDVNKSVDLKPLDLDKKFTLLNKSIKCGAVNAKVNADVDAKVHAVASVGVAAQGTIIPPKLTDIAFITGLNAQVTGTLSMTADVAGSISSGSITLLNLGIPGLDFPGILTVGPSFQVDAKATANFDVNLDLTTDIALDIKNAKLTFPPGSGDAPDAKAFSIGDTPVTLSASPDVKATGSVAVHLIPSLQLGISALGNKAKADIALSLDASASMQLSLEASADLETVIDKSTKKASVSVTKKSSTTQTKAATKPTAKVTSSAASVIHTASSAAKVMTSSSVAKAMHTSSSVAKAMLTTTSVAKAMHTTTSSAATTMSTAATPMAHTGRAVSTSFGGCFEIDAGVDVTASANAAFFGLFNANKSVSLFKKNFVILKKCFGAAAPKRSLFVRSRLDLGRRAGLSCPSAGVKGVVPAVDQTIKSAAIKAA
ncbi:hypothetical protein C8R47DRAFT_1017685 [Mycena vitilis]|nr:hypothetical protein C8R47DRAFT_1017685 [Mycena vitilis]